MITQFFIGLYMHQAIIEVSFIYNCEMQNLNFTFKTLTIQVVKISKNCYSEQHYIDKSMLMAESILFH